MSLHQGLKERIDDAEWTYRMAAAYRRCVELTAKLARPMAEVISALVAPKAPLSPAQQQTLHRELGILQLIWLIRMTTRLLHDERQSNHASFLFLRLYEEFHGIGVRDIRALFPCVTPEEEVSMTLVRLGEAVPIPSPMTAMELRAMLLNLRGELDRTLAHILGDPIESVQRDFPIAPSVLGQYRDLLLYCADQRRDSAETE